MVDSILDGAGLLEGESVFTLDPAPVLKTITFDVAEEGLALLGVDVDELFAGKETDPKPPPLSKAGQFFMVVLEEEIDAGSLSPHVLSATLEVVAAHFFMECLELAVTLRSGGTRFA